MRVLDKLLGGRRDEEKGNGKGKRGKGRSGFRSSESSAIVLARKGLGVFHRVVAW